MSCHIFTGRLLCLTSKKVAEDLLFISPAAAPVLCSCVAVCAGSCWLAGCAVFFVLSPKVCEGFQGGRDP